MNAPGKLGLVLHGEVVGSTGSLNLACLNVGSRSCRQGVAGHSCLSVACPLLPCTPHMPPCSACCLPRNDRCACHLVSSNPAHRLSCPALPRPCPPRLTLSRPVLPVVPPTVPCASPLDACSGLFLAGLLPVPPQPAPPP